ncbi:MAG: hypothetical protein RJA99_2724 [Pseudomonadota bacterium]|jgi:heat shock protein HtpX
MLRIALLAATSLSTSLMLVLVVLLAGLDVHLASKGATVTSLFVASLSAGLGGALLWLLFHGPIARFLTRARLLETPLDETQVRALQITADLAARARIRRPELAFYPGPPGAFATAASCDDSMLVLSSQLPYQLEPDQLEAVIAHEIAQIADGEAVTLTLLQGALAVFVDLLPRLLDLALERVGLRGLERGAFGLTIGLSILLRMLLCLPASLLVAAFARAGKLRSDARAAALMGREAPMIAALERLDALAPHGALLSTGSVYAPHFIHSGAHEDRGWLGGLRDAVGYQPPTRRRIEALRMPR